jgi:hypothetical protein
MINGGETRTSLKPRSALAHAHAVRTPLRRSRFPRGAASGRFLLLRFRTAGCWLFELELELRAEVDGSGSAKWQEQEWRVGSGVVSGSAVLKVPAYLLKTAFS